ncbi:MAG TPA: RDD family protein [Pyrinomonadaceae bacterium]|nr:RDD family protein [Pyrinomonadaceae bacterium]
MTLCTSCGTENAEGMKFCVKCGAALAPAPDPGSWKAPSGDLYATTVSQGRPIDQPFPEQPGSYTPPPVPYPGYGGGGAAMATAGGVGGYPYAEWIDRVLAALIDFGISAAVMVVLYFIFGVLGVGLSAVGSGMGDDAGGALGALGSGVCCFGILLTLIAVFGVGIYNKVYLVSKRGFSIGQGVMKLKVSDAAGNIPTTGALLLRLLVQVGMGYIPFIGFFLVLANVLWPLWDEKKQTLHDKAVGTFVVKTA